MELKKLYFSPAFKIVCLDNNISLQMVTPENPPNPNDPWANVGAPGEAAPANLQAPNQFNQNPFQ